MTTTRGNIQKSLKKKTRKKSTLFFSNKREFLNNISLTDGAVNIILQPLATTVRRSIRFLKG